MPGLTDEELQKLEEQFRQYEQAVRASRLKPNAQDTYVLNARNFVRWIKGEFTPGGTL